VPSFPTICGFSTISLEWIDNLGNIELAKKSTALGMPVVHEIVEPTGPAMTVVNPSVTAWHVTRPFRTPFKSDTAPIRFTKVGMVDQRKLFAFLPLRVLETRLAIVSVMLESGTHLSQYHKSL